MFLYFETLSFPDKVQFLKLSYPYHSRVIVGPKTKQEYREMMESIENTSRFLINTKMKSLNNYLFTREEVMNSLNEKLILGSAIDENTNGVEVARSQCIWNHLFDLGKTNEFSPILTHIVSNLLNIGRGFYGSVYKTDLLEENNLHFTLKFSEKEPLSFEMMVYSVYLITLRDITKTFVANLAIMGCSDTHHVSGRSSFQKEGVYWCLTRNHKNNCMLMESVNNSLTLEIAIKVGMSGKEFNDVVTQILGSLLLAQKSFHFYHNDLHPGNILVQRELTGSTYRVYGGFEYYFLSPVLARIIDYGMCTVDGLENPSFNWHDARIIKSHHLSDAYKLIMFSAYVAHVKRNKQVYRECERIYKFFRSSETMADRIKRKTPIDLFVWGEKYFPEYYIGDHYEEFGALLRHVRPEIKQNPNYNLSPPSIGIVEYPERNKTHIFSTYIRNMASVKIRDPYLFLFRFTFGNIVVENMDRKLISQILGNTLRHIKRISEELKNIRDLLRGVHLLEHYSVLTKVLSVLGREDLLKDKYKQSLLMENTIQRLISGQEINKF